MNTTLNVLVSFLSSPHFIYISFLLFLVYMALKENKAYFYHVLLLVALFQGYSYIMTSGHIPLFFADLLIIGVYCLFLNYIKMLFKTSVYQPLINYMIITCILITLEHNFLHFNSFILGAYFACITVCILLEMIMHKLSIIVSLFFIMLLTLLSTLIILYRLHHLIMFMDAAFNVLFILIVFLAVLYNQCFYRNNRPAFELLDIFVHNKEYMMLSFNVKRHKFQFLSKNLQDMFGYTEKEFTNNISIVKERIIHKEDYPVFEYIYAIAKESDSTYIIRLIKKDGSTMWTEQRLRKIFSKTGQLLMVHAIIKDITVQKMTEFALAASNRKYRELFDNASDIIMLINLDKNEQPDQISDINKYGLSLLGYSRESANHLHVMHLFTDKSFALLSEKMAHTPLNKVVNLELSMIHSNGGEAITDANAIKIYIDNAKCAVIIARDITEKNRIKEQLRKLEEIETLSLIASGIAHDFNNILTSLIGDISLSLLSIKNGLDCQEYLLEAEKISYKAKDLTQQLLTFSKEGILTKKDKNINDLLKEITIFSLRGSNITYLFDFKESDAIVNIDEAQMSRVISNIVINAKQAMLNGGNLTISTQLVELRENEIPTLAAGKYLTIAIEDQGGGISPDVKDKIFTPFFTTKPTGNGLGLASSFSIVIKHQGTITVKSRYGVGTTFTIYLPFNKRQPYTSEIVKTVSVKKTKGKILLMDDDDAILRTTGKMLTKTGYEVDYAHHGEEAIMLYKQAMDKGERYDIALFDLTIPGGLGGKETLEQLYKIDPSIRAIVSSGYSNDDVMANYKEYHFIDRLPKPYTFEMLQEVIVKNI